MTDSQAPSDLVPAGCDLRDFAFMPLQVERLRRSKAWLKCKRNPALAFYMVNLWTASWHDVPAGSLEDDDDVLADLAMCTKRRWSIVRDDVLKEWVPIGDGRIYNPAICEKALVAWSAKVIRMRKISRRTEIESGEWDRLRSAVFARDDYTCQYCGDRGVRLECDHVVPVSAGGLSIESNLVTACRPCNRAKGAKPLRAWRMSMTQALSVEVMHA